MTLQRAALWAIVVAATIFLLVSGRGLLLPIVLGIVLWYMIDALADTFSQPRFGRFRLPQPLALLAAVLIIGGLFGIVGRTIGRNVSAVVAAVPNYENRLTHLIEQGAQLIGLEQTPTLFRAVRPRESCRYAGQRRCCRRFGRECRRSDPDLHAVPVRRADVLPAQACRRLSWRRPGSARTGRARPH